MTQTHLAGNRLFSWNDVRSTRLFVVVQGVIGGLAGITHGIFEILQGNRPTPGPVFDYTSGAFTILPTYLISGIATVCVGLALIVWTLGFIHRKKGPTIFLLISIVLFLVGGGIAQVLFFLIAWAVSTRINRPPNWWKNELSGQKRKSLARLWLLFFSGGYTFLLIGIAIWLIFTPPGTPFQNQRTAYLVCWSCLIIGFALQILTIVSGFARDIDLQARGGKYAPGD
ncbi:MAG: hypothetical protein P4L50_29580 [Anaerolineaceae bacterium]|nr:hypothetical protein [Anaerolineaceae bacterium]